MTHKQVAMIDTDPGIDDALAIVAAAYNEKLDIRLITTVAGNVSVDLTTRNALQIVDMLDLDVEVAQGAMAPLMVDLEDASKYHGASGLGGFEYTDHDRTVSDTPAIQAMAECLAASDQPVTIFALGPLTNVALLLNAYPQVKDKIKDIIIMGGSLTQGNTTTAAEFNFYTDPHAAAMVFQSGLPIYMFGLNVTTSASLRGPAIEAIQSKGPLGERLYSMLSHYQGGDLDQGLNMHDSCTIAYFDQPGLFDMQEMRVEMITEGFSRGASVVDLQKDSTPYNAHVAVGVDSEAFEQWMLDAIDHAAQALGR